MFKSFFDYSVDIDRKQKRSEIQEEAERILRDAGRSYADNDYFVASASYGNLKGLLEAGVVDFSNEIKAKIYYRIAYCFSECYKGNSDGAWNYQETLHNFKLAVDLGKDDYYANFNIAKILYQKEEYDEALKFAVTAKVKNKFIPDTYLLMINIRLAMGHPTVAKNHLFDLINIISMNKANLPTDEAFLKFCKDKIDLLNQVFDLYCLTPGADDHPEINEQMYHLLVYHLENLVLAEDFNHSVRIFELIQCKAATEDFLRNCSLLSMLTEMCIKKGMYRQVMKIAFFCKMINPTIAFDVIRYCNNLMDEDGSDFESVLSEAIRNDGLDIRTAPAFYLSLEKFMDSNRVCIRDLARLVEANKQYNGDLTERMSMGRRLLLLNKPALHK